MGRQVEAGGHNAARACACLVAKGFTLFAPRIPGPSTIYISYSNLLTHDHLDDTLFPEFLSWPSASTNELQNDNDSGNDKQNMYKPSHGVRGNQT
jgi:hypothetical protein